MIVQERCLFDPPWPLGGIGAGCVFYGLGALGPLEAAKDFKRCR